MGAAGRRVTIRFHEYCGKPYLVDFFLRMKYIHTWYASSRWQAEVQYAPKQASERGTDIALSTRATQISASAKGPVFCFRFRFCFRFFVFFRLAPPLITKHRTGLRTPKSPTHVRAAQNNVSASYERTRSVRFAKKKTKKKQKVDRGGARGGSAGRRGQILGRKRASRREGLPRVWRRP